MYDPSPPTVDSGLQPVCNPSPPTSMDSGLQPLCNPSPPMLRPSYSASISLVVFIECKKFCTMSIIVKLCLKLTASIVCA